MRNQNQNSNKSAEEWKGDYLSGNDGVGGGGGNKGEEQGDRFVEVGSP